MPSIGCLSNVDCDELAAGECLLEAQRCFENTIERAGTASPLGGHCIDDPGLASCTTNGDCAAGASVGDTAVPTYAGVFCTLPSSSAAFRALVGLPGPGTLTWPTLLSMCRCGDGSVGCSEECDDRNQESGDGCDQACRLESSALRAP
jgi:cysteine-rich repeat protein